MYIALDDIEIQVEGDLQHQSPDSLRRSQKSLDSETNSQISLLRNSQESLNDDKLLQASQTSVKKEHTEKVSCALAIPRMHTRCIN